MAFTRLGYLVILAIIATAAAAIAFVLWPDGSSTTDGGSVSRTVVGGTATAGASAEPTIALYPSIGFQELVPFVRLGAVASIDATNPQQVLVNFRPDFDTSGFGTPSHTFQTVPPAGQTIEQALDDAGIPVNAPGGIQVIGR
jgi:hypothetical protein